MCVCVCVCEVCVYACWFQGHHAALSQGHGGLSANANPIELQSNTKAMHVSKSRPVINAKLRCTVVALKAPQTN